MRDLYVNLNQQLLSEVFKILTSANFEFHLAINSPL